MIRQFTQISMTGIMLFFIHTPSSHSFQNEKNLSDTSYSICFRVKVPDPNWELKIEKVIWTKTGIWQLGRLDRIPGPAIQRITEKGICTYLSLTNFQQKHFTDHETRIFLKGKTWSWKNPKEFLFVNKYPEYSNKTTPIPVIKTKSFTGPMPVYIPD